MTKAGRLKQSSLHWMDWGIVSHGRCLTAKILKFPNPEIVCTLSDVLEKSVEEKYFLLRRQVQKLLYKGNFTQGVRVYSADGTAMTTWYPDGMGNNYGENGEIAADGTYDVYFRPDGQGGEDWFYGVMYVAAQEQPTDEPTEPTEPATDEPTEPTEPESQPGTEPETQPGTDAPW